jgi:hypothetical protein
MYRLSKGSLMSEEMRTGLGGLVTGCVPFYPGAGHKMKQQCKETVQGKEDKTVSYSSSRY